MLAVLLVSLIQTNSYAIDDVWGGMGLTEDAVNYDNSYSNTVFDKYTKQQEEANKKKEEASSSLYKYPANLSSPEFSADPVPILDSDHRTIKTIEFYGLNSVSQDEITQHMQLKEGSEYTRASLQEDLRTIRLFHGKNEGHPI